MSGAQYKWDPGYRASGKQDAQSVGDRIEALRRKLGRALEAEDVVNDAETDEASPFRAVIFAKNPQDAAREWYLHEARNMLRSVVIVRRVEEGGGKLEMPDVTLVQHVPGHGYELTANVIRDPDMAALALGEIVSGAESWRLKLLGFERLLGKTSTTRMVSLVTKLGGEAKKLLDNRNEKKAARRRKKPRGVARRR